jgi:hypothetical protein
MEIHADQTLALELDSEIVSAPYGLSVSGITISWTRSCVTIPFFLTLIDVSIVRSAFLPSPNTKSFPSDT